MASLSPSTTTTTTTNNLSAVARNPLQSKSSQLSAFRSTQRRRIPSKISCNAANNNESNKFDRRNLLIGLGGLYGAATTLTGGNDTLAAPTAPDATQCVPAKIDDGSPLQCCPPKASQFLDFKLPKVNPNQLRFRPAAHLVDDEYLAKYSKALALMKALPDSDPRSFKNQANVHCAYCNGGYNQVGLPNLEFQVHGSWLFFPFHRAYLYFYERILANLIDDPTFSIPYWNWDHPDGMYMPSMFNDKNSPFFDAIRDQNHLPPTLMNLSYDGPDTVSELTNEQQIEQNLTIMYKQMVVNAKKPVLFLGAPYRAGDPVNPGPGTLEIQPHGTVHNWTGNPPPNTPFWEDMGNFYSAGRDPIFYAHHGNVDRTWSIWKNISPKNKDFKDKDFLNSYFYFYDENANPIKIYVKDVLDTKKLGYDYQPMELPWLKSKPTPKRNRRPKKPAGKKPGKKPAKKVFSTVKNARAAEAEAEAEAETDPVVPTLVFPRLLDNIIRTNLARPRKSRTQQEKDDEEEILVIDVESRSDVYSKFDVYVNDEDESPTLENRTQTEYAGSFVNVPHRHGGKDGHLKMTTIKFGLSELIDDLDANDDEGLDIIFVPRTGTDSVIIKDVRIEFQD